MKFRMTTVAACSTAILSLTCATVPVLAQTFPNKPVTIITAYPPGGGADLTARIVAQELSEQWKQPVIVDSKPGAGSTISAAYVARAPADGYTLLMSTVALATAETMFKNLPYNYLTSLAPISLISQAPFFLAVRPGLKVNSVAELIAMEKAKPESLNYASSGQGSIPHLAGAWMGMMSGTRATHVPYQGSAPAIAALMGDQVDFMFADVSAIPAMKAGKIKALAVSSAKRAEGLPNLPAMAEFLPGFDMQVWAAIEAPAGTPKDIIAQINAALQKASKSPNLIKRFDELSQEAKWSTPEELAALKTAQVKQYKELLTAAGVKLE